MPRRSRLVSPRPRHKHKHHKGGSGSGGSLGGSGGGLSGGGRDTTASLSSVSRMRGVHYATSAVCEQYFADSSTLSTVTNVDGSSVTTSKHPSVASPQCSVRTAASPSAHQSDSGWDAEFIWKFTREMVQYFRKKKRGKFLLSDEFECAFGTHWSVRCYPRGTSNSEKGSVSLFAEWRRGVTPHMSKVIAAYELNCPQTHSRILNSRGKFPLKKGNTPTLGSLEFVDFDDLMAFDSFDFICKIKVLECFDDSDKVITAAQYYGGGDTRYNSSGDGWHTCFRWTLPGYKVRSNDSTAPAVSASVSTSIAAMEGSAVSAAAAALAKGDTTLDAAMSLVAAGGSRHHHHLYPTKGGGKGKGSETTTATATGGGPQMDGDGSTNSTVTLNSPEFRCRTTNPNTHWSLLVDLYANADIGLFLEWKRLVTPNIRKIKVRFELFCPETGTHSFNGLKLFNPKKEESATCDLGTRNFLNARDIHMFDLCHFVVRLKVLECYDRNGNVMPVMVYTTAPSYGPKKAKHSAANALTSGPLPTLKEHSPAAEASPTDASEAKAKAKKSGSRGEVHLDLTTASATPTAKDKAKADTITSTSAVASLKKKEPRVMWLSTDDCTQFAWKFDAAKIANMRMKSRSMRMESAVFWCHSTKRGGAEVLDTRWSAWMCPKGHSLALKGSTSLFVEFRRDLTRQITGDPSIERLQANYELFCPETDTRISDDCKWFPPLSSGSSLSAPNATTAVDELSEGLSWGSLDFCAFRELKSLESFTIVCKIQVLQIVYADESSSALSLIPNPSAGALVADKRESVEESAADSSLSTAALSGMALEAVINNMRTMQSEIDALATGMLQLKSRLSTVESAVQTTAFTGQSLAELRAQMKDISTFLGLIEVKKPAE